MGTSGGNESAAIEGNNWAKGGVEENINGILLNVAWMDGPPIM